MNGVWGSSREHAVIDALTALVEQLQGALEAHHVMNVTVAAECATCSDWAAGLAQRFEQVDASLRDLPGEES